jgi:pimeloyl-ACP methyl ester carboxylesterase
MPLVSIELGARTSRSREARLLGQTDPVPSDRFDDDVQQFLLALVRPTRRRAPRRADRFDGVAPTMVQSPAGPLAAWRLGTGPAVLLVHGWEDDSSLWSPLVDELANRGRAVVAFDLPAHGESGGDWGLGFEGTDGVHAVAAALGPIDAIVGHSFGAGCASLAITEGLAVERAVFIAPPLRTANRWLRYADRLGVSQKVAAEAERIYGASHGASRTQWNPRAALPQLDVELLVVHSVDDERNPFDDSEDVVSNAPRARLFTAHGLTHRRTARDPDVVTHIASFVSQS